MSFASWWPISSLSHHVTSAYTTLPPILNPAAAAIVRCNGLHGRAAVRSGLGHGAYRLIASAFIRQGGAFRLGEAFARRAS